MRTVLLHTSDESAAGSHRVQPGRLGRELRKALNRMAHCWRLCTALRTFAAFARP